MSIKAVNALSHYTDWTIGHVHSGALGWVGFIVFGTLYYLVPVLWGRDRLYSQRLVAWHFWIATLGIVLAAAYGLRFYQKTMTGPVTEGVAGFKDVGGREITALAPIVALTIIVGIFPATLSAVVNPASDAVLTTVSAPAAASEGTQP